MQDSTHSVDFVEAIHIQLSDKTRKVVVFEMLPKD